MSLASCSSEDHGATDTHDAASDAIGTEADAGVFDSGRSARDAAKVDAAPLAVACEGDSCATSLTTTLGRDEGYCALLHDGTVACWGQNYAGQLGRGVDAGTADSERALRVPGVSDVVRLDHSCAVDKAGSAWCWGRGPFLRDPTSPATTELSPVKLPIGPATLVSVRFVFRGRDLAVGCAVVGGEVLCWGQNADGQVAVPELGADTTIGLPPKPIPLPPGAPIRDLVVGRTTFVLREDGTALSWGANPPLGRVSSLFPDPYPAPLELPAVSNVDNPGGAQVCATSEGAAYCWGIATSAEQPLIRARPKPVILPEPVFQVATSPEEDGYDRRGCACGVSGAVYCWGTNGHGEAGDGTRDAAVTPAKVVGLPGPAAHVTANPWSTCALLTSGKIYCWGDNTNGQLGGGQLKPSLVPQEVVLP